MGIDLEIRPVGVTTENRTMAGCLVNLAMLVHDMKTTVTYGKVKTPVGAALQFRGGRVR